MTLPSAADLSARLAQLSPERRALLERALLKMAPAQPTGIVRRSDDGPAPLSYAQEFLWLIEQAYPGRAPYNVPRAFRVRGALDVEALEGALTDLVERHAVLRTRIEARPTGAVQRVVAAQPVRVERADAADEASLHAALRAHARRPFDLANDQLLRALVLRTGADEAVLQLVVHHVTSDGWSRNVTLRDLGALYAARRRGARATLEPLPIDYADYAVWQRAEGERAAAEDLAWWRAALEGAPAQLDLPSDRPRTGAPSFDGARLSATIPRETLDALAQLARRENASLFMVLLAAYGVLLHRHTGQTDLVVGSPVAGRALTETHAVVGLFANTLALRVRCDGDPTFTELLGRVRAECLEAFEHQGLPFERLASELQRERGGADGTLVQTLFSLHDAAPEALALDGATTEVLATEPGWSKVDLTIAAAERPDGLGVLAEYRTDLFDRSTIERLVHHFGVLLGAIATDAHRAISTLPLLDAAERAAIVEAGTGPRDARTPECVHRMVEATVATKPQATAVVDERRTLTYAELDAEANRLAGHLIATGVRSGDAVAICLPRRAEMVVALLATLKTGAHYVPLDPEYPADRLAYILEDSGAKVVVAMSETRARVPASARTLVVLDDLRDELANRAAVRPDVDVGPESLAYVLHTSGSTGKPKGVMIPHRAVSNFLRSMAERPGLATNDAIVAVTTLSFDIAGLELWLPLVVGARVVIAPRTVAVDGGALVRLVERTADEVRPNGGRVLLQATPATWRLMLDASWTGTEGLRMLCGGEAWSADLAAPLLARGESLWNVYGPTETTIWSSVARVVDASDVRLGEPIANTTLLVLDARREPVPIGVAGELYIGGSGVALGYLGRADLTAERFIADAFEAREGATMYRTGDLVRRRADGALEYLGRIDQQVKVRGFRIELGEVESALARLDEVQQAVVVVRGATADARLVAYVVPRGDAAPNVETMRAGLRRSLPDYMVPAQYVVMQELPLTPNGKIDRRALPEPDAAAGADRPAPVAPRTPTETRIAEVWREVLGVAELGVEDDFFALGGHSLLAMRVVARLAGVLPARVTIGDLFESRTIAALAALVDAPTRETNTEERIVRAAERGSAPLSLAQQAVWTAEQRTPESAAYHAPIVTHVQGALDVEALQRAVDAVVARHESLRTTFEERGGEPVQVVHAGLRVRVEQMDLRGATRADVERALERIVREPFALSRGPLLRVRVLRTGQEEWLVALVAHHLVFDGGSEPILLRELGEAYDAVIAGNAPSAAPNAIEIADWSRWERAQVEGTRLDGALRYWRTTLAGAPAAIALPTDASPDGQSVREAERAARVVSVFPPELYAKVTRLARALDATPFMVLLSGFQALLSRFARQDDLVIGTPVSRRDRAETQPLIGFLTNTVPLRATIAPETRFADLVVSARERLLAGFAHSTVPVERIAAELGGGALFDTLFVLQEQGDGGLGLAGCTTEPWPVEIGAAKVDLSLSMTPTAAGLRAALIYRTARFQPQTAERLLEHLARLLGAAADSPTERIADLPLLGESDRARLAAWNDTRADLDVEHTLHELIAATAVRTPHAVAVEDEYESLSYDELDARAAHLAHALRELGVGPGKLVGICAERSVGMVVGLLGILKAGGAYVPIDPEYPADRVSYMLADSGVGVLLTQTHLAGSLPAHGAELVLLDDPTCSWSHDDDPPPRTESNATPNDPAYMIYTSGSTGRPKGALNAHRGIVNRLAWMQQAFGLTARDVVLQKTPMSFDVSVWEFFWPLLTGAKLVMARPGGHKDPTYLADVIERAGVTVCHFVPSMLRAFVGALEGTSATPRCASLRAVMASGEALPPDLVAAWYRTVPTAELHNLYGPTECAVDVSWWACPPRATPPAVVPIGRPIANTRLYVLDGRGQLAPIGVPGELHLAGIQVGLGYHNRPELTAERFVRDPFATGLTSDARMYRTGDLARWLADGTVEYLGRLDFQVKLRGHRIELGEIEQVAAALDGVRGALATLYEDPALGPRLVCYYVAPVDGIAPDAVSAALRLALPEVMVPSAVVRLDEWPLTPSGKVDRRALPAPTSQRANDDDVQPRTAVERVLARLVASVLGRDDVGVTSDFFALGGHSLLATRVVTQASRLFRVSLTLRGFFAAPTVAGLAEAIVATVGAERAERVATLAEQVQRMTPEEREKLRVAQAQMKQEVGIS